MRMHRSRRSWRGFSPSGLGSDPSTPSSYLVCGSQDRSQTRRPQARPVAISWRVLSVRPRWLRPRLVPLKLSWRLDEHSAPSSSAIPATETTATNMTSSSAHGRSRTCVQRVCWDEGAGDGDGRVCGWTDAGSSWVSFEETTASLECEPVASGPLSSAGRTRARLAWAAGQGRRVLAEEAGGSRGPINSRPVRSLI